MHEQTNKNKINPIGVIRWGLSLYPEDTGRKIPQKKW